MQKTAETPAATEIDRINGQPRHGRERERTSVSEEPPNKRGREESTPLSTEGSPPPRRLNLRQAPIDANAKIQSDDAKSVHEEKTLTASEVNASRDVSSAVGPIDVEAQDSQIRAMPAMPAVPAHPDGQIVDANTGNGGDGLIQAVGQNAGQGDQPAPNNGALVAADSVANHVEGVVQNAPEPALQNNRAGRAVSIITLSDDTDPRTAARRKAIPARQSGVVIDVITISDDEDEVAARIIASGQPVVAAKREVHPKEVRMEDILPFCGRRALQNYPPTPSLEDFEVLNNPEEQGLSRYKIQMVEQKGVMAKYAAGNIYHYQCDDSYRNVLRLPAFPTPETWMPVFRSSWKLLDGAANGFVGKLFLMFTCNQKLFYEFLKFPFENEHLDDLDEDQSHLYWVATPLSKTDHESRFTYYRYTSILALYKFYEHIWDKQDYSIFDGGLILEYEKKHIAQMEQYWMEEPSREPHSFKKGYIYLRDLMERTDDCTYLQQMPRALLRLPTSFKEFIKGTELYETIKYTFKKINLMCDPVFEQLDSIKNPNYTLPSGECLQKLLLNIGDCIFYFEEEWSIAPDVTKKVFERIPFGPRGTPIPVFIRTVRPSDQEQEVPAVEQAST